LRFWDLGEQKSISPIFYEQFFCTKVFCMAFLYLQCGFLLFWQKNIDTKAACKIMVNLTTKGKKEEKNSIKEALQKTAKKAKAWKRRDKSCDVTSIHACFSPDWHKDKLHVLQSKVFSFFQNFFSTLIFSRQFLSFRNTSRDAEKNSFSCNINEELYILQIWTSLTWFNLLRVVCY